MRIVVKNWFAVLCAFLVSCGYGLYVGGQVRDGRWEALFWLPFVLAVAYPLLSCGLRRQCKHKRVYVDAFPGCVEDIVVWRCSKCGLAIVTVTNHAESRRATRREATPAEWMSVFGEYRS